MATSYSPLELLQMYWQTMLQGCWVTVELTVISGIASIIIGVFGAAGRLWAPRPIQVIVTMYVEVVRGTPQILQLFIIFFGLTQYGVNLSPFLAAAIWLVLYGGAYAIETFRAGILSVPEAQREAAAALGLGFYPALRKVVLPQAVGVIVPSLVTFMILQLKSSALAFTVGAPDIMNNAGLGAQATSHYGVFYIMAAVLYLILNLLLSWAGKSLEKRVAVYR